MNETGNWFYLILLAFILGPLAFWIISLLIAWVKWLLKKKHKAVPLSVEAHVVVNYPDHVELAVLSSSPGLVEFKILDMNLRVIKPLGKKNVLQGEQTLSFDGFWLSSGNYFIEASHGEGSSSVRFAID